MPYAVHCTVPYRTVHGQLDQLVTVVWVSNLNAAWLARVFVSVPGTVARVATLPKLG